MTSNEGKARRAHISHFLENAASLSPESFSPSVILPCSYWSSNEKASFFRSLARHSRWKPDLIAEDIGGSKTAADVCSYIELLQKAAAHEPCTECSREEFPTAHEVSQEWMEMERSLAEELLREEPEWLSSASKQKRDDSLNQARDTLRGGYEIEQEVDPQGEDDADVTVAANWERNRILIGDGDNVWKELFEARKQELTELWKREDILSSLNKKYLKTMDLMLRDAGGVEEEELFHFVQPMGVEDTEGGSDDPPIMQHHCLPGSHGIKSSQVDSSLPALDVGMATRYSQNKQTDLPVSLANQTLRTTTDTRLLPAQSSHTSFSMAQPPGGSNLTPPPLVTSFNHDLEASPGPIVPQLPSELSPATRRRLRKRLWTRRKRALENGLPPSEVSMEIAKLKRGRKTKPKAQREQDGTKDISDFPVPAFSHAPSPTSPIRDVSDTSVIRVEPIQDETGDGEIADGLESAPKRKSYGRARLEALRFNGTSLRVDKLDLFHLGRFANLMSLLRDAYALHDEPGQTSGEEDLEQLSAISYSVLRLLRVYVTHFITRLIAHVLVHKDVETRQKRRIRGIFLTGRVEEIREEDVREALDLMGAEMSSRRFFGRLKHALRSVTLDDDLANKVSNPRDRVDSDESEGERMDETPSLDAQFHQSARFRGSLSSSFEDPDTSAAMTWNPFLMFSANREDGDFLVSDEMDEAAIAKELRAEAKLDELDNKADRLYERNLWAEIGSMRDVELHAGETAKVTPKPHIKRVISLEPGSTQSLMFRKPGRDAKSRVYIDSDADE